MSKTILKLGTRRSLLAQAQSQWVAREIEQRHPDLRVELVGIDTRGDRILDVSLQSVQGKEFFVAELDEALRSGAVDFTVHSMKDLSLDRPEALVCAAIPARKDPRDVILYGPGVMEKIALGQTLKIGTSSPRRLENIPTFLATALPRVGGRFPRAELVEIRGNVNTRLSRVHEPAESPRSLDAVVLAFAGLIRLWDDAAGQAELRKLLAGVRWMVLPLRECPTAPGQGALAVECRSAETKTREILGSIHDERTARRVGRERELLARWGGGCHQRFGATAVETREVGELFYVRGVKPDGEFVDALHWDAPPPPAGAVRAWDGARWRARGEDADRSSAAPAGTKSAALSALFIAHARALVPSWQEPARSARVWTSGVPSWQKLAAQGVWVEGCAEGLGFDFLSPILAESVLQLPPLAEWQVLTHAAGAESWSGGENLRVVATYEVDLRVPTDEDEAAQALRSATHVFWSSASQLDRLREWADPQASHFCGPGKTASRLRERGLKPIVFPSVQEWRKWLNPS